jgi:hypothetical protein
MKTNIVFVAFVLGGAIAQQAVACDYTHTTAAQSSTVVACAGGKCESQAPTTQQGTSSTEAR